MNTGKNQLRSVCSKRPRKGIALLMTLAAIVLLSGVVIVFLSEALNNRQMAFSSANTVKADRLAQFGLETVIGELRMEMVDGSDVLTAANGDVYLSPQETKYTFPIRVGVDYETPDAAQAANGTDPISPATALGTYTLTKVSANGEGVRPDGAGFEASSVSLDVPSLNQRYFSEARWFGQDGPQLGEQATLPTWIYVTRNNGIQNPSAQAAGDASEDDYVIGRFAYTVYDVSGLLDANVAGYPDVAEDFAGGKSSTAYADLSQLDPSFTKGAGGTIDKFVSWRNGASADSESAYTEYTQNFGMPNGFLAMQDGQNAIVSRRDLLRLVDEGYIPQAAAPYFTAFSKTSSSPSWGPLLNASEMENFVGGNGTSATAYFDEANDGASANRFVGSVVFPNFFNNVRHYNDEGDLTRYDVQQGDPLVTSRFSLAKLGWLTWNGPKPGISSTAIMDCFGLQWDGTYGFWRYMQFAPDSVLRIKTLEEVASEGREPNFFEMLNAGILSGSLGQHPGEYPDFDIAYFMDAYSGNKARHLLTIGANIIDQYDEDSYPTVILANKAVPPDERQRVEDSVAGQENLPYFHRLHHIVGTDPISSDINNPDDQYMAFWFVFELWNLYQQKKDFDGPRPLKFRIRAYGDLYAHWFRGNNKNHPDYSNVTPKTVYDDDPVFEHPGDPRVDDVTYREIFFTDNPGLESSVFFAEPTAVTLDNRTEGDSQMITAAINYKHDDADGDDFGQKPGGTSNQGVEWLNHNFMGIFIGESPYYRRYSNNEEDAGWMSGIGFTNSGIYGDPHYTIALEFWDGFRWRPYTTIARMQKVKGSNMSLGSTNKYPDEWDNWGEGALDITNRSFAHTPDPRTDRFSLSFRRGNWWKPEQIAAGDGWTNQFSEFSFGGDFPNPDTTVFRYYPGDPNADETSAEMHWMMINDIWDSTNANTSGRNMPYYADPDGVVRPADGIHSDARDKSNNPGDGHYMYQYIAHQNRHRYGRVRRRAVILDRPFQSVGELGFAYRDLPGRNLDLWTTHSADAGLLDLFSLTDEPGLVAGKVNLNTAPAPVLASLLAGGRKASLPSSTIGTPLHDASEEVITAEEAQAIADAIAAKISADKAEGDSRPFTNRADLVMQLADTINEAIDEDSDSSVYELGNAFKRNKAWAEAPVRALAQVTETGTWNLMIDLVAQAGRITPNADSLEDFVVEGEKRYWLHLTIDRTTGKVLTRQLEPAL